MLVLEAADRGRKGQAAEEAMCSETVRNECKFLSYLSKKWKFITIQLPGRNERFHCDTGGPRPPSTAKTSSTFLSHVVICFPPVPDLLYKREYSRMRVGFQEKIKMKLRKSAYLLKILASVSIFDFL
ncbi:MAG TPA: hypothetical protein PK054_05370 [Anaerohalosphaeraceae bacterium]|nr:hypothetical protein [Anaerohalosphaeraceae bacterium]HPP55995.1 hypothetical protein [Anaerohalosphaeraceae bacterium]